MESKDSAPSIRVMPYLRDLHHESVLHDARLGGQTRARLQGAVEDDETRAGYCLERSVVPRRELKIDPISTFWVKYELIFDINR